MAQWGNGLISRPSRDLPADATLARRVAPAHGGDDMSARDARRARLVDPATFVLFDGAIGTMFYAKGIFINQCYDELNLRNPELVRDIHRAYRQGGAEVLETNTFGANRLKLAGYGLEQQADNINRVAAQLARDVAGDDLLVAGAVGPLGVRLEPYGPTSPACHFRIDRNF